MECDLIPKRAARGEMGRNSLDRFPVMANEELSISRFEGAACVCYWRSNQPRTS